jgi:uncharacterized membrane protein
VAGRRGSTGCVPPSDLRLAKARRRHDGFRRNAPAAAGEAHMSVPLTEEQLKSLKTLTVVNYGLYAAALVFPVTAIVAIVINYVKKDDAAGTWLESHFRWQIRTFWFGLLWAVLGFITYVIIIGWVILIVDCIWIIYRVVKGWLNLNDNKPMYMAAPGRDVSIR